LAFQREGKEYKFREIERKKAKRGGENYIL
jgi:hypothetical protein